MAVAREQFEVEDGRIVTLAMDSDPPLGGRTWGVVSLQLVDEITGQPPAGRVFLRPGQAGFTPRVGQDGFVGLVAIPQQVFPNLRNQPYSVTFGVEVEGYMAMELSAALAQAPTFPQDFVPASLGRIELHAAPSVLRGRVVQVGPGGVVSPVAGATLEVTGFWAVAPTPLSNPPASAPNLVFISPPVYAGRSTGGGSLRRVDLLPTAVGDKSLLDAAPAGGQELFLSDRDGVAAGSLVWIEPNDPERGEILRVLAVSGASSVTQPATLTLELPLACAHPRQALARALLPQPPGFTKTFTRAVYGGDATLYLSDLAGVTPVTVEISGDGLPPEYHQLALYSATSAADGYYRLPPIQRAAQLGLRARLFPLPNADLVFSPDYLSYENRVDFVFRP